MRKNILAMSIAAMIGGIGFSGAASAGSAFFNNAATAVPLGAGVMPIADELVVQAQGIGHILVVPYFSTQDGNVSLLNIVNTDLVNGKAIKLRYRGAANSDDVYDITVLLSPGDVWSANVSNNNGVSTLVTNDNSCTLPANVNADFTGARANGDDTQTLEGYIEILNMADVPKYLAKNATGAPSSVLNPLYTATKHVNGVAPCSTIASQLLDVVAAGATDITDATTAAASLAANEWNGRGFSYPSGGLMANWSIVNLSKAGSFTGAATAIAALEGGANNDRAVANLVFSPQDSALQPSDVAAITAGTHPVFLTADPLLAGGTLKDKTTVVQAKIPASLYDFPDLSTPYVTNPAVQGAALKQAETLSAALATMSVTNEYLTSPSVSFATDWTFSMPARRYNVAYNYSGTSAAGDLAVYAAVLDYADNIGTQAAPTTAPVVIDTTIAAVADRTASYFTGANTTVSSLKPQVCVKPGDLAYYDTSEQGAAGGSYVISPQPIGAALAFCGEVSVLSFNGTSVLGAEIAKQNITTKASASTTFTDGWMSIKTPGNGGGLPVIGHAFAKALGSSANLGGIWAHRTDRTGL